MPSLMEQLANQLEQAYPNTAVTLKVGWYELMLTHAMESAERHFQEVHGIELPDDVRAIVEEQAPKELPRWQGIGVSFMQDLFLTWRGPIDSEFIVGDVATDKIQKPDGSGVLSWPFAVEHYVFWNMAQARMRSVEAAMFAKATVLGFDTFRAVCQLVRQYKYRPIMVSVDYNLLDSDTLPAFVQDIIDTTEGCVLNDVNDDEGADPNGNFKRNW